MVEWWYPIFGIHVVYKCTHAPCTHTHLHNINFEGHEKRCLLTFFLFPIFRACVHIICLHGHVLILSFDNLIASNTYTPVSTQNCYAANGVLLCVVYRDAVQQRGWERVQCTFWRLDGGGGGDYNSGNAGLKSGKSTLCDHVEVNRVIVLSVQHTDGVFFLVGKCAITLFGWKIGSSRT